MKPEPSRKTEESHFFDMCTKTLIVWAVSMMVLLIGGYIIIKQDWVEAAGGAGSFLQGTLGVAVAFAGAWIAIKITSLANKIVEKQHNREKYEQCSRIVEEIATLFSKARFDIEQLIWIFIRTKFLLEPELKNIVDKVQSSVEQTESSTHDIGDLISHLIYKKLEELKNKSPEFSNIVELYKQCLMDLRSTLIGVLSNSWASAFLSSEEYLSVKKVASRLSLATMKSLDYSYWAMFSIKGMPVKDCPTKTLLEKKIKMTEEEDYDIRLISYLGQTIDPTWGRSDFLNVLNAFSIDEVSVKDKLRKKVLIEDIYNDAEFELFIKSPVAQAFIKNSQFEPSIDAILRNNNKFIPMVSSPPIQ